MGANRERAAQRRAEKHKARRKDAGKRYGQKVRDTRDKSLQSMADVRKTIEEMVTQEPDLVAEAAEAVPEAAPAPVEAPAAPEPVSSGRKLTGWGA